MMWRQIIDIYYPVDRKVRGILLAHSAAVARRALQAAQAHSLPLTPEEITTAAMLHDIGIIRTDAPGIDCHGTEPYMRHGILGAEMLRSQGVEEKYALVAERHTGSGLTREEIISEGLPLPLDRSYMPQSLLEQLICWADCFYSKTRPEEEKPLERVRASLLHHGPASLARFEALEGRFGAGSCPD